MAFIDSGIDSQPTIGPGFTGSTPLNLLSNSSNTTSGISSLLSGNTLGTIGSLAGGGIAAGLGLFDANQPLPFQNNLTSIAANAGGVAATAGSDSSTLFSTGNMLLNSEVSGQLPTGAQAQVQQYIDQQTAQTKARYASLGLTGSTMESDALNNVQTGAASLQFSIAQQMAQTGLQAIQQSLQGLNIEGQADSTQAGIYENLMKAQTSENQSVLSTIGNFASSLGKAAALV